MAKEKSNLETMRHSLSHVLAMAVLDMFPEGKLAIGPAIDNGFYYDFDLPRTLIPEDLPILEKKMKHIVKQNLKFERQDVPVDEALKISKKAKQPYKTELVEDLKKAGKKTVSFYKTGSFVDLCEGPHVESTNKLGAFTLSHTAGAYWKGDEKNKMLQRIYAYAFETQKELDEFLKNQEELKKRDHRKIGKDMDLFCFSALVGAGLPLFTPKGVIIIEELKKHVEKLCSDYGFQKISTPALANIKLFEISGHKQKFGDELFHVTSKHKQKIVLRPVTCPHMGQVYASRPRSYRDLPIRYMESDKMFRAEKPGEVGGLNRVYAITVEDGHTFCRVDQVKEEVKGLVKIIKEFYTSLGMFDEFWVSLSFRDPKTPEKYIGDTKDWETCEKMLKEVSKEMGLNAKVCEGEAALYGPKIDFQFKAISGKEFAIPTVQLDFSTPKSFGLVYTDEKGKDVHPVMVHRAILGSYERFFVLLLEHFAGDFPLWLAPVQVKVIPVSDKFEKFAKTIEAELKAANIRVEFDESDESVGKKIRNAEMQKIPYMLVLGEKEVKSKKLAVRSRKYGDLGQIDIKKLIEKLKKEIGDKK
ncbi:MAG: threonine--tRNA ligase [Patescibacteria group bacterium]